MTISEKKIYPRTGDTQTVYLKRVITDPNIEVGAYTIVGGIPPVNRTQGRRYYEKSDLIYPRKRRECLRGCAISEKLSRL